MADDFKRMGDVNPLSPIPSNMLGRSLPHRRSPLNIDSSARTLGSPMGRGKLWNPSASMGPLFNMKSTFGTPSYPSPLDRIRTGKRERAAQLGLSPQAEESFEANQSFPRPAKSQLKQDQSPEVKCTLQDFKGDGMNDFSFAPGLSKGTFAASPVPPGIDPKMSLNISLGTSWSFYNYVGGNQVGVSFPTTVRNPNKAIVTIKARTTEILTANEMACELFGYTEDELAGARLTDLIRLKKKQTEALTEDHMENDGELVMISGKVFDAVDATGLVVPVSVWLRTIPSPEEETRCIAVMEPVERNTATVTFDSTGTILLCDNQMAYLHGYDSPSDLVGQKIKNIIPSLKLPQEGQKLPKDIKKQRATGRTKDGSNFPLSIALQKCDEKTSKLPPQPPDLKGVNNTELERPKSTDTANLSTTAQAAGTPSLSLDLSSLKSTDSFTGLGSSGGSLVSTIQGDVYTGIVWVFANISGMVSFLHDGTIHSCNSNFALMLFGYTQDELVGKDITYLIPDFYEEIDFIDTDSLPLPPIDDEDEPLDSDRSGKSSEPASGRSDKAVPHDSAISDVLSSAEPSLVSKERPDTAALLSEAQEMVETATTDSGRPDSIATVDLLASPAQPEEPSPSPFDIDLDKSANESLASSSANESVASSATSRSTVPTPPTVREGFTLLKDEKTPTKSPSNQEQQSKNTTHILDRTDDLLRTPKNKVSVSDAENVSDIIRDVESRTSQKENMSKDFNSSMNSSLDTTSSSWHFHRVNTQSSSTPASNGKSQTEAESHKDRGDINLSPLPGYKSPVYDLNVSDVSLGELHNINAGRTGDEAHAAGDGEALSDRSNATSEMSINLPSPSPREGVTFKDDEQQKTKSIQEEQSSNKFTSTPSRNSSRSARRNLSSHNFRIPEGSYCGHGRHKDSTYLGILFQIKCVELDDGQKLYCMWVSRDPTDPGEGTRSFANLTLATSFNSTLDASMVSLGEMLADKAKDNSNSDIERSKSRNEQPEELSPGRGKYDEAYDTTISIGKGAFGFVKLAKRKDTGLEVVVKFIRKAKVLKDCWVDHDELGKIPFEINLLAMLEHTNIVTMLEAFENDEYFQVVMEKHGSGMDLFEFIDRNPNLDERLASYIFRQLVAGVGYLHGQSILHRDIKDENIIMNEKFCIKIIDFGSAAYMRPGKVFSTFCGTLEYCSPEVLMGNRYRGPELEIWSMGVTLYTLIFGENPFYDVDETIQCILKPPFMVSRALMHLIGWILHPDPLFRATITDLEKNSWIIQPIDLDAYDWNEVLPNSEFHGNTAADNRPDTTDHYKTKQEKDEDIEDLESALQRCLDLEDVEQEYDQQNWKCKSF